MFAHCVASDCRVHRRRVDGARFGDAACAGGRRRCGSSGPALRLSFACEITRPLLRTLTAELAHQVRDSLTRHLDAAPGLDALRAAPIAALLAAQNRVFADAFEGYEHLMDFDRYRIFRRKKK